MVLPTRTKASSRKERARQHFPAVVHPQEPPNAPWSCIHESTQSSSTTTHHAQTPQRPPELLPRGDRAGREDSSKPPKPCRRSGACVCALGKWIRVGRVGFPLEQSIHPLVKQNRAKTQICCVYSGKTPRCKRWEFC